MKLLNLFKKGRHFSVLVIPDGDDRTFNFRLSSTWCKVVCIVGALCVTGVVFITVNFWGMARSAYRMEILERENRLLRRENSKVLQLQKTLYEMKEIDHRLRRIAGTRIESDSQAVEEEASFNSDQLWQIAQKMDVGIPREMSEEGYPEKSPNHLFDISEEWLRATPNLWPVQGWVSAEFNVNVGPLGRRHTGIDIAAPSDSPVRAAADGLVTFVSWTHDLGNLIMIQHDAFISTRYGHNSRVLVWQGERVRKGQTIAFVGNSGRSSAPHLHFEIWKDGSPVNPRRYLLR
jgi:murein DD-endopeptidase MepM/ murein hydrolase activator NlpD